MLDSIHFAIRSPTPPKRIEWIAPGTSVKTASSPSAFAASETTTGLGLEPTIEGTLWQSLALANTLTAFATTRRYTYHSVGALGVVELTAPTRVGLVAEGLKRLGVEPSMRKYFHLHAVLDLKHSEDWNEEALKPLVAERPEAARAIAEGALIRLECGKRCFEAYRKHLWEKAGV